MTKTQPTTAPTPPESGRHDGRPADEPLDLRLPAPQSAPAQGETPRIYEACLNWDNTGDYRKRLVSVEYYEQLKRELNEAKTLYAAALDTLKDMSAQVAQLTGAQDRMDAEIAMLTADLFRATSERDQARQDIEERCAENDRERAAHLQAYQEACKERDAARRDYDKKTHDLYNQLTAAESELAELRLDRERLDWLEKNAAELRVEWDDGEAPLPWPEFTVRIKDARSSPAHKSHRAAIDAALSKSAQGEGEK